MKIELQAFLLRSDIPPEGKARPDTDDGADNQELKEPLRTAALEAGLTKMRRPPVISYTLPSLEATEYAKEQGKYDEFHKACYKAYWEEFQDIGKLEVLESIASDCGLDWSQLEERLRSGHYRETVMRQYKAGVDVGVRGIPAFIIGNNGFMGAMPYEAFQRMAQEAMSLVTPKE